MVLAFYLCIFSFSLPITVIDCNFRIFGPLLVSLASSTASTPLILACFDTHALRFINISADR